MVALLSFLYSTNKILLKKNYFKQTNKLLTLQLASSPLIDIITNNNDPIQHISSLLANDLTINSVFNTNAWSVNNINLNSADIASNIFASSIFPYLALLYFLSKTETKTPKLSNFGFQFLLVFVFATIPAGIIANVDVLHGVAESFLTITNLLIIQGFRMTRTKATSITTTDTIYTNSMNSNTSTNKYLDSLLLSIPLIAIMILYITNTTSTISSSSISAMMHSEPWNALSIPTWVVHSSSLLEWLVAMKLIWEHATTSGNPSWKGMTWGMIPSHASGLCACTYHLFYNSPILLSLVTLQAMLTVIGNTTMAYAAYKIYSYEKNNRKMINNDDNIAIMNNYNDGNNNNIVTNTILDSNLINNDLGIIVPLPEDDQSFWLNMFIKSTIIAMIVKYGELFSDIPFQPSLLIALSFIVIPTILNILKWNSRSNNNNDINENTNYTTNL